MIPKLLVRGVANLIPLEDIKTGKLMDADCPFYCVEPLKTQEDIKESAFITVGIDYFGEWVTATGARPDKHILKAYTTTFVPLSLVKEKMKGKRQKAYLRRPRYNVDELTFTIKKDVRGEYVKGTIFCNEKNSASAYNLDAKKPDARKLTRSGILFRFIKDMKKAYGDLIEISLSSLSGGEYRTFGNSRIDKEYKEISEAVKEFPIRLENLAGSDQIKELLQSRTGIKFVQDEDVATIAVVHPESYYREQKVTDPYKVWKSVNVGRASQAVTLDASLKELKNFKARREENEQRRKNGKKPKPDEKTTIIDTVLANLLVKQEIVEGRPLISRPSLPNGWFVLPVQIEGDKETPWRWFRVAVDNGRYEFAELSKKELSELSAIAGNDDRYLLGKPSRSKGRSNDRFPMFCNIETREYMFFVRTGASVIPDDSMIGAMLEKVDQDKISPLTREQVEELAAELAEERSGANLSRLLEQFAEMSAFYLDDISKAIGTKAGDKDKRFQNISSAKVSDFFELVTERTGLSWRNTLKRTNNPALNAIYGFYFDKLSGEYFAGNAQNRNTEDYSRFNSLYQIIHSFTELPDELPEWFNSLSVRTKQSTVYPFIFKHVREFAIMQGINPVSENVIEEPKDTPAYSKGEQLGFGFGDIEKGLKNHAEPLTEAKTLEDLFLL
ncbi:hypothetical protein NX722_23645 [Endozoicomonas gorgoniicola]|uniref:Uncharacterized protein n=1 Tax=Endozoicomonas gorgoniicola TaxID=1234144 RepID=A0ABT3N1P8_9GAMM|nr:hypothetical protein [Endozoicomonas gorgoniicola]MCW7555562.1 hypothetical protein [Endozoicomonas gorgoniicola]